LAIEATIAGAEVDRPTPKRAPFRSCPSCCGHAGQVATLAPLPPRTAIAVRRPSRAGSAETERPVRCFLSAIYSDVTGRSRHKLAAEGQPALGGNPAPAETQRADLPQEKLRRITFPFIWFHAHGASVREGGRDRRRPSAGAVRPPGAMKWSRSAAY
jgi:hypothetical protein